MTRLIFASLLLAACSGADGPFGAGTQPGSGTQTLTVEAGVSATETVDNATLASNFSTDFSVRVTRTGQPVTGAQVSIASSAGVVTLAEQGDPGSYAGTQAGYLRVYGLTVEAGADKLEGAQLVGPTAHAFTAPTVGFVQKAGLPLDVKWDPAGAQAASIETREMNSIDVADSGAFTVAGSFLAGKVGELRDDRIRVRRSDSLDLAGGAAGSSLSISVRNEITFNIDAR
jgi:hypothetical protein